MDVGSLEMLTWKLNKRQWQWRDFVTDNDEYDITITGNGQFSFEIDSAAIVEAGHAPWKSGEIEWHVDTEHETHNVTESVNNPETPVSLGEEKRWRIRTEVPEDVEREEIPISNIYIDVFSTGRDHITRNIQWRGEGESRVHFPNSVIVTPVDGEYIPVDGRGAIVWQQEKLFSEDDVSLSIDGSRLSFSDEFIYRSVEIRNEMWKVVIDETFATIYLDDEEVGTMYGQGLPFRIAKATTEDVQLDCSVGFVQLRRGLGPRFEGWDIGEYSINVERDRAITAWGVDASEALENLPYYDVRVN